MRNENGSEMTVQQLISTVNKSKFLGEKVNIPNIGLNNDKTYFKSREKYLIAS